MKDSKDANFIENTGFLNKIEDIVYTIGENICMVFMLLMVLIVCITVFGRFVLNKTPAWGDEIAIACMIWFGLVSSSLAERDDRHIRVSIVDKVYPKRLVRVFHIVFYILKIAFGAILTYQSIRLVIFNKRVFMTGAPKISEAWVSLAGVVMGVIMLFYLITRFKKEVLKK
ncbi:MAG: TRAP transporter small permease [Spirochaetales bacterium]|nr:TRAP transporter small permease [Spirochaetales bacterium]